MKTTERRKKNGRLGFSLAETLLVVAILIILAGLGSVAILRYQRTLRQVEFDGIAKEIFVAAQNSISIAKGQGYLGRNGENSSGLPEDEALLGDAGVSYFIVDSEADPDSDSTILSLILPKGSIDDTVRKGGSYIIRYQRQSGVILDVFYSAKSDGRFGHSFLKSEYPVLMTDFRSDAEGRRNYGDNKHVIGYYGGAAASDITADVDLLAPTLTILNAERLSVTVKPADPAGNLRLIITGEDSAAVRTFELTPGGGYYDSGTYCIILDDITQPDACFKDILGPAGFVPGENLIVMAQAYAKDSEGNEIRAVNSPIKRTNSIFADLDTGSNKAVISNIRHLENLCNNISGFTGTIAVNGKPMPRTVAQAEQTTDLYWDDFTDAIGDDSLTYVPVTPYATLSYDGGGHVVGNIVCSETGNAGMFGNLSGGVIEDLVLENFDISCDGNAGALVGSALGVNFSKILAYNNASSAPSDGDLSITSIGANAGGLIGAMTGGQIENCAAALYVRAGGYGGGLVGRAESVSAILSSYSGGHTINARYSTDSGFNVTGDLGAGGLAGMILGPDAEGAYTEVAYSYSTCSVCTEEGGCAGGLVASAENASFAFCYTTAFVKDAGNCGNYIGSVSSCEFEGTNYYLTNLSPKVTTADSIKADVQGISGKNDSMPNFIFIGEHSSNRRPAYIYDNTLKVEYDGTYYFPTVEQLHQLNGDSSYTPTAFTSMHYGDWQVPNLESLGFNFKNLDTLYLDIDPQNMKDEDGEFKENYFVFSLTGDTSLEPIYYEVYFDGGDPVIKRQGVKGLDENSQTAIIFGSVSNPLPISKDDDGHIIITLDDITKAGHGFSKLFSGTPLIPGENVTVNLVVGQNVGINQLAEVDGLTENSLFAYGKNGSPDPSGSAVSDAARSSLDSGDAYIMHIRHLQNLDPAVSNVDSRITGAVLNNDITWDGANYAKIYRADGDRYVSGTFYGIYNPNLTEFDGNGCALINFPIRAAGSAMSPTGAGNAGLFRYVGSNLLVHDLRLKDCVIGDDDTANAGSVIAQSNGCKVTLNTVLADSATQTVRANGAAGGLIGLAGNSDVYIDNSAASVFVAAQTGPAGGLVAELQASSANISKSYAGGHTVNGAYATASPQNYNIRSASGPAGGLVGVASGDSLVISQSFSGASVAAQNTSQPAGGIIGDAAATSPLKLSYVYSIAPVYNVRTTAGGTATLSGALVGRASQTVEDTAGATSVYYLPELYVGTDDSAALDGVAAIGSGSFNRTPGFAYYQKDVSTANLIAAKTYIETMQIKTIAFDNSLSFNRYDSNREYPFSIWTSFDFDGKINHIEGYTFGTYYGDWQPIDSLQTVPHTISFFYVDPRNGETVSLAEETLGRQSIREKEVNRVLTPYVEPFTGYQVSGWTVTYKDQTDTEKTLTASADTGYLQFSENQCYGNITATAQYTEVPLNPGECTLAFYYDPEDPTGKNYDAEDDDSVFEQIGKTEVYARNTSFFDIESPNRVIEGYNFVGWYDSPDFSGTRYDLANAVGGTEVFLENDLSLYAKYERIEFYNITIDFMFSYGNDPDKYEHLQSVPRYRFDDQPQYRIQCVKGANFIKDITLPSVGGNFINPVLTDYNNNDEEFLRACNLYISDDGKMLHVQSLVDDDGEEDGESQDLNLVVVYQLQDEGITDLHFVPYTIEYVLADTAADGSYSEGSTFRYNPYQGEDNTFYFKAPVGTVINVRPKDEGYITGTSLVLEGFVLDEIEKLTVTENSADNVVHVYYSRREFVLTYNSLGGTYIYPVTCVYGTPLAPKEPTVPMVRQGYAFDTDKGDNGWTILDLGVNFADDTSIATKYHWNEGMPAANIVAWANWESKPVEYRVMYWYENSDSENANDPSNYSYMGSQNATKNSGSTVNSSDYRAYNGLTNASWKDTTHFTFNNSLVESKAVSSDGTTVLNVYFTRNSYTLTFNGIKGCSLEEHIHTDSCYWYCTLPEHPEHTADCLVCEKEEHVHDASCCSLEEHIHGDACCSISEHTHTGSCCSLEEHAHDASCCTIPEHTHSASCCTKEEHIHSAVCCSKEAHTHDGSCCKYEENHVHSSDCGPQYNSLDLMNRTDELGTGNNKIKASNYSGGSIVKYNNQWYVCHVSIIGKHYWYPVTGWDCGQIENHTHGGGNCVYTCGKTEHAHDGVNCTYTCGEAEHAHDDGTCTCSQMVHVHGDGNCSCSKPVHAHDSISCAYTVCGLSEHVHGDGTCNYSVCGKTAHTHDGASCNYSLCGKEAHVHSDAENCYIDAVHVHSDECLQLICGKAEHIHKDCFTKKSGSTYSITAKYDAEIKDYFPIYADNAVQAWEDAATRNKTYTNALVSLDRMPGNNVTFNRYSSYDSRTTVNTIYYYMETANADDPAAETVGGHKFELYKTVPHKFNYLTYDEEFHTVSGFTRYAHTCSNHTPTPNTNNTGHSMYPVNKINKLYYTRNSYNIEFYIGATKVNTISVKYGARLNSVSYTPTGGPAGFTFDGWYKDPGLTNMIDFSTATMPLGNLAVYGRWAPPAYSVVFNADYIETAEPSDPAVYKAAVEKKTEGTTVKYDPADATNRSFIVESGSTISEFVTDAKGFMLDSYTPEKSGYTFEGWYYDLVGTDEVEKSPFISSIAITEPIVVYADWEPITNAGELRDITIYYYHALQNKPIQTETVIKDTYSVGERPAFTAPEIYGYYPVTMVQYLTVQSSTGGSANSITFFYMPITEWTYRTEYYVSYRSYESDTSAFADGTFSDGTSSYLICSTDGIPAYDQFVNVKFSFPEGYEEGYRLVQYDANGSIVKTTNTIAQLEKRDGDGSETEEELKMLNVVKFYIEPDPEKFAIRDRITTYNGESQTLEREDVTSRSGLAFPNREYEVKYTIDIPDFALDDPDDSKTRELTTHYYNSVSAGYSVGSGKAFVANEYRYFTSAGLPIDDPSVSETERRLIDAGVYRMNGYVVISVTGVAEGEEEPDTRIYLEWTNVNYDLNLRIQPRPVTITSATASQAYNAAHPLVRSNPDADIQLSGPDDGKAPFVGNAGASYFFAVDAFRLETGVTDNAFTYVLNEFTNPFNYYITTKFGTLTVY